jgi:hypothetical protein
MSPSAPSPQPDLERNRLPTLFEVLSRRTLPPVDLFSFYIYMRDQQRSVDYLDFWYVSTRARKPNGKPGTLPKTLTGRENQARRGTAHVSVSTLCTRA